MPDLTNVFIKVNADFMLSDEKDPQGLVKNFSELSEKAIIIYHVHENGIDEPYVELKEDEIFDGILEMNLEDESVHVICDAIFKLHVPLENLDGFLSVDKWYLLDVPYKWNFYDVVGSWDEVTSGLEPEKYAYMTSRWRSPREEVEAVRYLITVKCAENKNDLE